MHQRVLSYLSDSDLEQIARESPTFAAVLERHCRFNISCLPQDLLLMCLSFCNLSDAHNIALVCRSWCLLLKRPQFWKRHIFARLYEASSEPQWLQRFQNIYGLMVPSHPPHTSEDLHSDYAKINFSWLFSNRNIELNSELKLYGANEKKLLFWFTPTNDCDQYGSFRTRKVDWGTFCWTSGKLRYCYQQCTTNLKDTDNLKSYVIWDDGNLRWEGDAWDEVAFGKGTWTWRDGRKFSGDNVAFGGEPHGKGVDENGNVIEYVAGYRKDELEESFQTRKKLKISSN